MKLIFAIIHDEDANKVIKELNEKGFSVTKLCSTGRFIRAGNTTLLIGTDEDKVDPAIEIIENNSKIRNKQILVTVPCSPVESAAFSKSVEVIVGGATIFVLDVERYEKV